jgi:hypothetical protein
LGDVKIVTRSLPITCEAWTVPPSACATADMQNSMVHDSNGRHQRQRRSMRASVVFVGAA